MDKLSKKLGIKSQSITVYEPPSIEIGNTEIVITSTVEDKVVDYNLARKTITDLITTSKSTLEDILLMSKDLESPRSYEVSIQLIKTLSYLAKDLVSLHDNQETPKSINNVPIQVDKGVFFQGSSSELLDKIKEENGK